MIAGYGELDKSFADQGRRLEKHLTSLGIPHEVKIYPGVGHSYMNDFGSGFKAKLMRNTPMHAGYDEDAAEDSWRRMLAFFAEHLLRVPLVPVQAADSRRRPPGTQSSHLTSHGLQSLDPGTPP